VLFRSDTVYWTEKAAGTVKSVPTCGGAITTLAKGQTSPGALAVDATWIFWVNDKTIMRKALAGGAPTTFVAATNDTPIFGDENDINALLVHEGTLFFGRYIYAISIPPSAGTRTVIGASPATDRGRPSAFAIDATHLYQTEISHGAISRESLDGKQMGFTKDGYRADKAPDRIAVSQEGLLFDALAVVNGNVIWVVGNGPFGPAIGTASVDALEVHTPPFIGLPADFSKITGFVVSGSSVYFGDGANNVEIVPLTKGVDTDVPHGTILASNQLSPSQFAADETNVYWRTSDCRIMKLAK
jgi:hypothetical protein